MSQPKVKSNRRSLLGYPSPVIAHHVLAIVREDAVCRRLMTVPGVGALVAVTYKSAMDDPSRITTSKAAGALFGLTPKKYQSGEKDVTGGITRAGDEMVRTALYEAANVLLARITRFSKLKRWGMDVARRRGSKRARSPTRDPAVQRRRWERGQAGLGFHRPYCSWYVY